jgi:hypothetical protein
MILARRDSHSWPDFIPIKKDAWMEVEFWRRMMATAPNDRLRSAYQSRMLRAQAGLPAETLIPELFPKILMSAIKENT